MSTDIVAISAVRTPIGSFGGTLRDVPAYDLGAAAIHSAIERSGIEPAQIDKVIFANCRQAGNGPNPARTAAVNGGVPTWVPVFTINMACPSGMKSAMLAAHELRAKEAHVIVTGGMELMSTMPYLLKGARWEGFRSGDKTLMDSWSDTIDPLCGCGMGLTAEKPGRERNTDRGEELDEFAFRSQRNAAAAREAGWCDAEIAPVGWRRPKRCLGARRLQATRACAPTPRSRS